MSQVDITPLNDREEVIRSTIHDIMDYSEVECYGMGRQIAWIRRDDFEASLDDAIGRNVRVRVIGADEGEVDTWAELFEAKGAPVKYYDHGDLRVALADGERALLAFPLPALGVHTNREYRGFLIKDEEMATWLTKRFHQYWTEAEHPGFKEVDDDTDGPPAADAHLPSAEDSRIGKLVENTVSDFYRNPAQIIGYVISALLGAAMYARF